eukprot:scaffold530_cov107-Cylindrotheca_fusiformis.AAC.11
MAVRGLLPGNGQSQLSTHKKYLAGQCASLPALSFSEEEMTDGISKVLEHSRIVSSKWYEMKPSRISVRKRFHSITIIISFFFLSLLLLLVPTTVVASTKCPSISPPTIAYSQKKRDVLALPPRGAIGGVEITSLLLLRGGGGASSSKDIIAKMKKPSKDAIILQQQEQEEQSKLKTTSMIRIGTETMVGILLMYLGETINKPNKPNLPILVAGGACVMVLVLFELAYAMLGPQDAIRLSLATTAMASLLLLLQL